MLRASLKRAKLNETAATFVETLAKYTFLGIGAIYALSAAGIDTAALVASLGIAGLTIGFAARDSLSNLISGLLIFIYQPFVIGDLIELDNLYGQVDTITLSSTRVITIEGKMLTIPNTQIINKTVASYTKFPNLRLEIPVTVSPNEDLGRIRQILIDLVEEDDEFLTEPQPLVVVSELNISNIKIMLTAWLKNERDHLTKRFQLRERVFTTLREAGVEMP
jgi:small conductance mechanosensitive channel